MKTKILIIEDNKIISDNIKSYLELEDFSVKQIFEGKGTVLEIIENNFDAIIMDLGLPDIDGLELCKNIREKGYGIPILMLTARSEIKDKIKGLKFGADDYMTKPFDYEELVVRLQTIIRRTFKEKSDIMKIDDIIVNISERKVEKNEINIHLSKIEFDLFVFLLRNRSMIISKTKLLEKVWGEYDDLNNTRTVDVYIGYLRKKLGSSIIETKRGEGYIIK